MKKLIISIIISVCVAGVLISCRNKKTDLNITENSAKTQEISKNLNSDESIISFSSEESTVNDNLILKINGVCVEVDWEDNASVEAVKQLATGHLTIPLERYGDFEQFGNIGSSIPSSDINQKANAGDIMLYQSNKIVLFYGTNNWSYTKLGHINLNESELYSLLGQGDVTITIDMEYLR